MAEGVKLSRLWFDLICGLRHLWVRARVPRRYNARCERCGRVLWYTHGQWTVRL